MGSEKKTTGQIREKALVKEKEMIYLHRWRAASRGAAHRFDSGDISQESACIFCSD